MEESGTNHHVHLDATHQDSVMFPENDRESDPKVSLVLQESVNKAPSAIHQRLEGTLDLELGLRKTPEPTLPVRIPRSMPPSCSRDFYDREMELQKLCRHFDNMRDGVAAFALHGIGGVGKTQLVLKYIKDHHQKYLTIIWISADTAEKVTSDLDVITRGLGLIKCTEDTVLREQKFTQWLQMKKQWLVVFDNVENIDIIKPIFPSFPTSGSVIITSRNADIRLFPALTESHEVQCLQTKEGVALLTSQIIGVNVSDEKARAMSQRLGGLPLAINHIACYFSARPSLTMETLISDYDQLEKSIVDYPADNILNEYDRALKTVFAMSFSALGPNEMAILNIIALLDPDEIKLQVLEHFEYVPTGDQDDLEEKPDLPQLFNKDIQTTALGRLISNSLIQRKEVSRAQLGAFAVSPAIKIHRLIQDAVRRSWKQRDWQQAFDEAVLCLWRVFPRSECILGNHHQCLMYHVHVLILLKHFKNNRHNITASLRFADVLSYVGRYLYERGTLDSALDVLSTAKEICDVRTRGRLDSTLASVYNVLGLVYFRKAEKKTAAAHWAECIRHYEGCLDHQSPRIQVLGTAYMNYGNALSSLEGLESAMKYLEKALDIFENYLRGTFHNVARALHNISYCLYRHDRFEEAVVKIKSVLHLQNKFKETTPFVLVTKYLWGNMQLDLKNDSEAYRLHRECLCQREEVLGKDHWLTAVSFYKVSCLEYSLGRIQEAVNCLYRSYCIFSKSTCDPGLLARTCLKLGRILMVEKGRYQVEDAGIDGPALWAAGVERAHQHKGENISLVTDADFNSLVGHTYY